MITVESLSTWAGGQQILHDLTFAIERGESLGIVGPNGAGKSTLLRHLAGLVKPTTGTVCYEGMLLHDLPHRERARKMAILMQNPEAQFHFTALEIVKMARYPYLRRFQPEGERDRVIIEETMEKTCTHHLRDRMLNEMSGGELQRVFLARALAQEPDILWLDEPTTFLDIFHQHELLSLLQAAKEEDGLTWVAVLHDLNLAAQYCDRLLLLAEGRLVAIGTPEEILVPDLIKQVYGIKAIRVENEDLRFPQMVFMQQALPPTHKRDENY